MINLSYITFFSMIENKPSKSIPSRTETLQRYHSLTSPLVPLQTAQLQESLKHQLRHNTSMRLDCIKNRNSKIYALESTSFSELKASAIVYQIPEFSSPDVNFQVAEHIKKKVEEIKNEVITHLPEISRSSNYAPKKLQHQLNHRSAVRQLEDWLKKKLIQPPTSLEDTIEYKNMIMGVGMKQLIRIIGKRCNQEGRIAEEIWEMTWGICREIILYLSKRAKKCQDLLQEELKYMRLSYQQQFQHFQQQNSQLKERVQSLQAENKDYFDELSKLRKRKQAIEQQNKHLTYDNFHIQQELKNILQENLAIYLQIGDKSKRGWIKKMYKSITHSSMQPTSNVANLYQTQIADTIDQRNKLEQVTEELTQILTKEQITNIGNDVFKKSQIRSSIKEEKRRSKLKDKLKNKKQKIKQNQKIKQSIAVQLTESQFITEVDEAEENAEDLKVTEVQVTQINEEFERQEGETEQQLQDSESDDESKASCVDLISTMKNQFKPIDKQIQTDKAIMIHAFASTPQMLFTEASVTVRPQFLTEYEEIGVNTEDIKEDLKSTKKKGKENVKEQIRSKSKLYSGPIVNKQKSKYKPSDKDKKSILDTVPQVNLQKTYSREEERQAARFSEIKQVPMNIDIQIRNATTSSRVNNEEQRFSEVGSVQPKITRENDRTPGKCTDNIDRNKMISFFNKEESLLEQSFLDNKSESICQPDQLSNKRNQKEIAEMNIKQPTQIKTSNDPPAINQQTTNKQESPIRPKVSKQMKKTKNNVLNAKTNPIQSSNNQTVSKKLNVIPPKEPRNSHQSLTKQPVTYLCANCFKTIDSDEPKFLYQREYLKPPKRQSDKSNHHQSLRSLKKLALTPIQMQESEREADSKDFEGRRLKKMPTRRSSGYIHDIAFKKEIEGQTKTPHSKEEDERGQNEDDKLPIERMSPAKWIFTRFQMINKEWINSLPHSQNQANESLEQYLQIVKEISSSGEGKTTMTDKSAISTIQKNIFPILNQLLTTVKKAVKSNKIAQVMRMFTSLPNIVFNRISRKYGVRILALKHLKILLTAFKVAAKFTDKYKTIELMMFTDCKSPQSEDLFIYLLIMGLFDPSFSNSQMITLEQSLTLKQICEEHLSKDSQVYVGSGWQSKEENSEVELGEILRSIITNYRLLKINRIEELGFIFLMLKKDHWMEFRDFVEFLSVFKIQLGDTIAISNRLFQFCDVKNRDQKIGITENMFAKFLTSSQQLSLQLLEKDLALQISRTFTDPQTYQQIADKIFSPVSVSKDYFKCNTHDDDLSAKQNEREEACSSSPNIKFEQQVRESLIEDYHLLYKKQKILSYWKRYSPLTYQIFSFLQNKQETKFLKFNQLKLIKDYLIVHILECQVENSIGIADYFSDSTLGLILTPNQQFTVTSKP